jgi:hypothetical protein
LSRCRALTESRQRGVAFLSRADSDWQHEKLRELGSIGVVQFDVYPMTEWQQETLNAYGKEIIPQFTGVAV